MSHPAHPPEESSNHSANLAVGLCLLIALGAFAVIVAKAPTVGTVTDESFAIVPPQVDAERLAADRAKHYGAVDFDAIAKPLAELEKSVRAANNLQFGALDAQGAHDLQIMTLHQANDVITKSGIEGFIPSGANMYKACAAEFEKLLAAVRSQKLTADQAEKDPGDEFAEYRSQCGNAFGPLVKSGVIKASGEWSDPVSGPLVFDIMNRFRWATVLDMRLPPSQQLSPYEYEVLTRWRASIRAVPVAKRLEWVVAAGRELPSFPQHELIGALLLEKGDGVGALGAYEEACKLRRTDLLLQRKCEFLRGRMAAVRGEH